jgi:hypothetical protein
MDNDPPHRTALPHIAAQWGKHPDHTAWQDGRKKKEKRKRKKEKKRK